MRQPRSNREARKTIGDAVNTLKRGMRLLYRILIKPKHADEDKKRQEFILNIILIASILMVGILDIFVLYSSMSDGVFYKGVPFITLSVIFLIFCFLLILSRKGYTYLAAYVLLGIYLAGATYGTYTWGISLPMPILIYAVIIVISSILVNTRFSFYITTVILGIIFILGYGEITHSITPDLYWAREPIEPSDLIQYAIIFSIIVSVSWLSNREIEKSIRRARASERALKIERDNLEKTVEERTRELRQVEVDKMDKLYRFAELGRLSSGIFHDLMGTLTSLSLNITELQGKSENEIREANWNIEQALKSTKRLESFITSIRKSTQVQDVKELFSLNDELTDAIEIVSHTATKQGISIKVIADDSLTFYGSPIKFHQIIINLLSNAIDAYSGIKKDSKSVLVHLYQEDKKIMLVVEDKASGISSSILPHIFDPFFTTKVVHKGTGLGLSTTKNVVERSFGGSIVVESKENKGTTFTVTLPLSYEQLISHVHRDNPLIP